MAKSIAILKYMIMFDPSEAWSTGYEFENQFADFFGAHGFEAQIVEARGGSGERVIYVTRIDPMLAPAQDNKAPKTEQVMQRIKQAQTPPSKDFKKFVDPRHPNIPTPKLNYQMPGRILRKKVRIP